MLIKAIEIISCRACTMDIQPKRRLLKPKTADLVPLRQTFPALLCYNDHFNLVEK